MHLAMRARLTLAALLLAAAPLLLAPGPAAASEEETTLLSEVVAQAQAATAMPADPLERQWWVQRIVLDAALRYGLPFNVVWLVAICESGADPFAFNPRSRAAGLFQFIPSTWAWASVAAGYGGASVFDPVANTEVAVWLMGSPQYGGLRHWSSCARQF